MRFVISDFIYPDRIQSLQYIKTSNLYVIFHFTRNLTDFSENQ